MTIDGLLKQEDCSHDYLHCDEPWRVEVAGRLVVLPQYTCFHPTLPHCGGSFVGRATVDSYRYVFRLDGATYFTKVKQK